MALKSEFCTGCFCVQYALYWTIMSPIIEVLTSHLSCSFLLRWSRTTHQLHHELLIIVLWRTVTYIHQNMCFSGKLLVWGLSKHLECSWKVTRIQRCQRKKLRRIWAGSREYKSSVWRLCCERPSQGGRLAVWQRRCSSAGIIELFCCLCALLQSLCSSWFLYKLTKTSFFTSSIWQSGRRRRYD